MQKKRAHFVASRDTRLSSPSSHVHEGHKPRSSLKMHLNVFNKSLQDAQKVALLSCSLRTMQSSFLHTKEPTPRISVHHWQSLSCPACFTAFVSVPCFWTQATSALACSSAVLALGLPFLVLRPQGQCIFGRSHDLHIAAACSKVRCLFSSLRSDASMTPFRFLALPRSFLALFFPRSMADRKTATFGQNCDLRSSQRTGPDY